MPREYPAEKVRNIGFIAHIDAGKTTVSERVLFYTGVSYKMGSIDEGTTIMDWMEQENWAELAYSQEGGDKREQERKKNQHRINIIDTPGHIDFTVEVQRSLRVLDGAIVIFDGVSGVEPQSETVWHQADKFRVPRLCFINKLDRIGADFYKSLNSIYQKLTPNVIPLQIPIGKEREFKGVIDLFEMKAYYFKGDHGEIVEKKDVPSELHKEAKEWRKKTIEKIVEQDEGLLNQYLSGEEPKIEELKRILRKATIKFKLVPAFCGSALKNKGIQVLLDGIVNYLPSPVDLPPVRGENPLTGEEEIRQGEDDAPFAALVFKIATDPYVGELSYFRVYSGIFKKGDSVLNPTTSQTERIGRLFRMHANERIEIGEIFAGEIGATIALKNVSTGDTLCTPNNPVILEKISFPEPVISAKIEPKTRDDEEKLALSLKKLTLEDPTFKVKVDSETRETIISGMGELHLEIIVDRLKREHGTNVKVGRPQVAYKETILKSAEAEGKYIRQSGGRGQYGHVLLRVDPLSRGEGYQFVDAIKGGAIPKEFISAVEKGVIEARDKGLLSGHPLVDFKATLFDGSFHEVDSSDFAFKIAGSMALTESAKKAGPALLEPIMKLEVRTPEEFLGEVIGDLSARRAKIEETKNILKLKVINAEVPLAEMFGYATSLRSLTEGRGTFTMEFDHYNITPKNIQEEIIQGGK